MNKVLNRPLFRQAALRKGHLKTIGARTGIMVGQSYSPPGVPAVVPGQGTFSPVNTQRFGPPKPTFMQNIKRSGPVRLAKSLGKGIFNIPYAGGYIAGDKVGEALGIENAMYRMPFGLAGSYAAAKALPGLAALPGGLSAALMAGPAYLTIAGAKERERIAKMTPEERAAHTAKVREFGLEGYLDDEQSNQLFSKFIPKGPKEFETRKSAAPKEGPGSGRPGFGKGKAELKAEGDQLLDEKYAGAEGDADLNSIQADSISPLPTPPGAGDDQREKIAAGADKDTPATGSPKLELTRKEKMEAAKEDQKTTNYAINGGTGGSTIDNNFDQTIRLARKYYDELDKGQGSQANLVFLSNLASGLLTGTTKKSGIGGALEVFGQALGPAVNNLATIRLKEGELRANRRESSLNAALDHMKFLNEAAKTERPDVTQGVIQFRGADGKLRNYVGYIGKGGTTYLPGGLGEDGQERLIPISQAGPITDKNGNVVGTFENFQKQDKINNRLFEISDVLGNRYNALSVARDVLKTLNQEDASGEKVKGGAALAVDQFTRRLSGVAKELVGLEVFDNDISQMTLGALEEKMNKLQSDEFDAIDRSDLSDEAKKEEKEKISKDTLLTQARKKLKNRGLLSGLTREEQEKLAVQEVTLTYALANTFKDQDRLTQRDVNAAKEIVNIFSLGRSSADVRASIEAIANQLESDIRRQEELFRDAGGLESRIKTLRGLADFETFEKGTVAEQLAGDLGLDEIEEGLSGVNL
tara:strand:+ start:507 stop:2771 length:2265 start_codon:yes stop_codon:yes gene_type:complete